MELKGPDSNTPSKGKPGWATNGWNADCHMIDCFIDALNLTNGPGGCLLTRDCHEVHLRNSLLRAGLGRFPSADPIVSAVRLESSGPNQDYEGTPVVNLFLEGSSLSGPGPRILHVGDQTTCIFNHSSAESFRMPYRRVSPLAPYVFVEHGRRHRDIEEVYAPVTYDR